MSAMAHLWSQRTVCTMRVSGIEIRLLGLAAGTFPTESPHRSNFWEVYVFGILFSNFFPMLYLEVFCLCFS